MRKQKKGYPLVDLFAGPGGLGEGFSELLDGQMPVFKSIASIEEDEFSYQTLLLRHFYRSFKKGDVPEAYYDYLSSEIPKEKLIKNNKKHWNIAKAAALKISLGETNYEKIKSEIQQKLDGAKKWVLLGGPPCQAYSLIGRSRMKNRLKFEEDERHFLYREYLKIIVDHSPPIFVMENVKGLLSARMGGKLIINGILKDLSNPGPAIGESQNNLRYRLYSFSCAGEIRDDIDPRSFLVKAEEYGVPQARHRIFILGIRHDLYMKPLTLTKSKPLTVKNIICSMPKIRSGVSKKQDSLKLWKATLATGGKSNWRFSDKEKERLVKKAMKSAVQKIKAFDLARSSERPARPRTKWAQEWYCDERMKFITCHESRSHMESDLHRYLFVSSYGLILGVSPKLADFPNKLLPAHENASINREKEMFPDRFRVQIQSRVSTTITSHISKDGHYFIHYDPTQCRSLTVREAARLQTFPDNYYFEGPRTSQYHQVGNAVPPYLAHQIAEIVKDVLDQMPED